MKRSVLIPAISLLLIAAGCSSGPEEEANPDAGAPPVHDVRAPEKAPAPVPAAGQEWDGLLKRLSQQGQVAKEQRQAEAGEHYRLAERWYQADDFDKAETECQKALQLDPDHAPAGALLLEVQFVQGKGKETSQDREIENAIRQYEAREQQVLLEIDDKISSGIRQYNVAEYDEAERSFRTVLEFAKWLPTGVTLETRRKQALDLLEKTKAARRQKEIDEERVQRQLIEDEKKAEDIRSRMEQKRELLILFGQAQTEFERERYQNCIEICDRILYLNPNLGSVDEMRMVAQRLMHHAAERDNIRAYVEEWKRTFENLEMLTVPQADVIQFARREVWEEIKKRRPRGLQRFDLDDLKPEDREIVEKLKSSRITIDMPDAPLNTFVDYLREVSGLNIVIDTKTISNPADTKISIKVTDIPLESVLKLALQGKSIAHVVEGGVVIITTQEALKKNVQLELYDVQDLTVGVPDFPGIDIALSEDEAGVLAPPVDEGPKPPFDGDALKDLITKTIDPEGWAAGDGKSVEFRSGLLIARSTADVHKKIQKFLSDLRASTGVMVSVETRFLTVEDNFLQQVGMDFRDLMTDRFGPIVDERGQSLTDDLQLGAVTIPPSSTFIDPRTGLGTTGGATTPGITWRGGRALQQTFAARVQNIQQNDSLLQQFFGRVMRPLGGATAQFTLIDDVSLEAIVRLVSRNQRSHVLQAPKLTLYNTQRGNLRISNQFSYVKDYNIQAAAFTLAFFPVIGVVQDGIILDVRPIVSADRRFITLELRPTLAQMIPPPPVVQRFPTRAIPIEAPVIALQRLKTTVVIPDKGTILLGGLSTFFEVDSESSIPIWRNIPILGAAGSNKYKGREKRQVLIIVSAHIIIPDEEERRKFE